VPEDFALRVAQQQWPQLLRELYSVIPHGRQEDELRYLAAIHQKI